MNDLTIVIPTKNEERHLGKCLECIGDFAKVLVVDSKSTDRTPEIAADHAAEFIDFSWNGNYPKKKNWVLFSGLVKSKWIMFLDADEFLTRKFKCELSGLLEETRHNGFWLNYENYFLGKRIRYGIPFRKLFLLRNGKGQFQRVMDTNWTDLDMEVHEQIEIQGTVGVVKSPLLHNNSVSLHEFLAKHNDYSTWEARRFHSGEKEQVLSFRQRVKRYLIGSHLLGPLYFIVSYFFYLGILDGKPGFTYALLKAQYFTAVKLKIDEIKMGQ